MSGADVDRMGRPLGTKTPDLVSGLPQSPESTVVAGWKYVHQHVRVEYHGRLFAPF